MTDQDHHDKLVAKIQHFGDFLEQAISERETLSFSLGDEKKMISAIKQEVEIYKEIAKQYDLCFENLLYKETL